MSKSLGNTVVPQDVIKQSGADILRLWVVTTDYWEDQRLGKNVLQTNIDAYRKLRNTIRWMLGTLAHDDGDDGAAGGDAGAGAADAAPAGRTRPGGARRLRRLRLQARHARRCSTSWWSSSRPSISTSARTRSTATRRRARSARRRSQVVRHLFDCLVTWLAPMLPFTMEEAWLDRYPEARVGASRAVSRRAGATGATRRWRRSGARSATVRRVVTGALEIERAKKTIGSSLEAAPVVHRRRRRSCERALAGVDMAEICITSGWSVSHDAAPDGAFTLPDVAGRRRSCRQGGGSRPAEMRALLALHRRRRLRPGVSGCLGARCRGAARIAGAGRL